MPQFPFNFAATGTLSYNGYTFSGAAETKASETPVLDDAQRTVVYNEYVFEVTDYISDSNSTDASVAKIRQQLTTPAAAFHYDGKGLGPTIAVNVPGGTVWDVAWGPIPKMLEMQLVGNNLGVRFVWRCVVRIPDCKGASTKVRLLAWNFDASWDISDEGMTQRTITGYAEIPLTRWTNSKSILDHADRVRVLIAPKRLRGFKRKQTYTLSKDRRRLNFTITDSELDYPYPEGVVKISVKQTLETKDNAAGIFTAYNGTISGSVTFSPGYSRGLVVDIMEKIVQSRLGASLKKFRASGQLSPEAKRIAQSLTPFFAVHRAGFGDSMFERTADFAVHYFIKGKVTLAEAIAATGMYQPLTAFTYDKWGRSLETTVFAPYGAAGVGFSASDDHIIDLCNADQPPQGDTRVNKTEDERKGQDRSAEAPGVAADSISPEYSWLLYQNELFFYQDQRKIQHKPINAAGSVIEAKAGPQTTDAVNDDVQKAGKLGFGTAAFSYPQVQDVIQRISGPTCKVHMVGRAQRIQYPIKPPELFRLNGQPLERDIGFTGSKQIGAIAGLPIIECWWDLSYKMTLPPPKELPAPLNTALQLAKLTGQSAQAKKTATSVGNAINGTVLGDISLKFSNAITGALGAGTK